MPNVVVRDVKTALAVVERKNGLQQQLLDAVPLAAACRVITLDHVVRPEAKVNETPAVAGWEPEPRRALHERAEGPRRGMGRLGLSGLQ